MSKLTSHLTLAEQQARSMKLMVVAVFMTVIACGLVALRFHPKGLAFFGIGAIPMIFWTLWVNSRFQVSVAKKADHQRAIWQYVRVIAKHMEMVEPQVGAILVLQHHGDYNPRTNADCKLWTEAAQFYAENAKDRRIKYATVDGEDGQKLDVVWRSRAVDDSAKPRAATNQWDQQQIITP